MPVMTSVLARAATTIMRIYACQIAASAALHLHSHTRSILRFKSSKSMSNEDLDGSMKNVDMINQDEASFMATDSVTVFVAAKEEVKQAVADDLNPTHSSTCEWFDCDNDQSATGLDVLVHRGTYEAAKGIYEQMLPEVRRDLKTSGNRARFRFSRHTLGGSLLLLLINLMLLIRGEAP